MKTGISVFSGIGFENQAKLLKQYGVDRTFVMSEIPDFDSVMELFSKEGIICETLHAPFSGINNMWSENEEDGSAMLARLKDSVDKCARYGIPVTIVHLSSGCPMPEINENGLRRYEELFFYADEKGVKVALENQRYLENLEFFMNRYKSLGFCWDCGHEYGLTKGIRFTKIFGDRLIALHIHDNRCDINTDDHLIPFDGKIDFEEVAKNLAETEYGGTLMLEVGKNVSVDSNMIYEKLTDEEFVKRAADSAKRVADMVESFR